MNALKWLVSGVAQLVEHHLAKVTVESSSLFTRSIFSKTPLFHAKGFFYPAHILTNTAKMVSEWLADAA